jgi:hypothetical protein
MSVDWSNAPVGAEFYARGDFYKVTCGKAQLYCCPNQWLDSAYSLSELKAFDDYEERVFVDLGSSGGNTDYYTVKITHPKRLEVSEVECEDIIRHLNMTFDEGEAFKAIWRNAALRMGGGKPGDTEIRNGEKVEHYGKGMQLDAKRRAGNPEITGQG